jgi:hypothetical protein
MSATYRGGLRGFASDTPMVYSGDCSDTIGHGFMLEAIGAILPFGVGVALSPVPIIAVIPHVGERQGTGERSDVHRRLLVGLAIVGIIVLAVAGPAEASDEGQPSDWVAIVGALLSGLNPKNLVFAIAAATAIAQTGIDGVEQAVAYAVFALTATIGVAIPVVMYFALGDRAPDRGGGPVRSLVLAGLTLCPVNSVRVCPVTTA